MNVRCIWISVAVSLILVASVSTQILSVNALLFPSPKATPSTNLTVNANTTSSPGIASRLVNTTTLPLKVVVIASVSNQNAWTPVDKLISHGFEIKGIVPIQETQFGKAGPTNKYVIVLEAKG